MHDPQRHTPSPIGHRLRQVLWSWIAFYLCYLLLVDTFDMQEMVAGLIIAALASAALILVVTHGMTRGAVRLHWFALLVWRLPGLALRDCGIVFAALWRRLVLRQEIDGAFQVIRFDPGGNDAYAAARRALVVAAVSLPPNSFVVSMDIRRGLLLVHNLVPPDNPPGGPGVEWPL